MQISPAKLWERWPGRETMNIAQRLSVSICALTGAMIAVALSGLVTLDAAAQKWPDKTVRIVTPFAPGGGTDVFARIVAQRLSELHGQQFIVENRPGAGSILGTEYVAKAPADGYTLLMTSASFSFNPGLYPKLRYDSIKDFAPVSLVVRVPHVIVVLPSFPVKNLQDLVKLAKARPGQVLYASSGPAARCILPAHCLRKSPEPSSRTCHTKAAPRRRPR